MKWTREKDYHGYRSYARDVAADGKTGRGIIGALKAALNFIARPTPSPVALKISNRALKLASRNGLQRAADCPFPTEAANDSQRDHRTV